MAYTTGLALANRIVSGFPLSIGTSQAFESVFPMTQRPYDPERKLPERVDPAQYDTCYINISTLFRNLVGALDKATFEAARIEDVVATLEEEMGVIQMLFDQYAPSCKPVFYYSVYHDLRSQVKRQTVPVIQLREATTELQLFTENIHQKALELLEKHTDSLIKFKDAIHPERYEKAFVLTHFPYDLVDFKRFSTLDLLESNTGILKPRYLWWTKLHPFGTTSLEHIPFHRKTLLCFGDRSLIKPTKAVFRKTIAEIAEKRNWNPTTTEAKMNLEIGLDVRDPFTLAAWKCL